MRIPDTRTRAAVLVVALVLTAGLVPLAAAQSGSGPLVSQATTQVTTGTWGLTPAVDDRVVQYEAGGQVRPSWIVRFKAGSAQSLRDWASSSDARRIVTLDTSSRTATVVAPVGDMGVALLDRWLGTPLSERPYITSLNANVEVGVDPVQLQPQSEAFTPPVDSTLITGAFDQRGVAYTDAPRGTPAEVRDILGFDNTSVTGAGVTIGIVDTGLNTAGGAVFGNGTRGSTIRVTAAKDFVNGGTGLDAVADGNGHGTWVAAALAANTTDPTFDGGLPDANLTIAKALADDGSGETADIVRAIRWQERQGADILSMSLGSPLYSQPIAAALRDYLAGNGTLAVIAAGNSRQNPATRFIASPADVPRAGVVSVAATTAEPAANASSAYFSQVAPNDPDRDGGPERAEGVPIDIAAPGMNLTVKVPTTSGTVRNATKSGTSMSTPWVGTVAGGILAAHPDLRNDTTALQSRLLTAARPIPKAGVTEVGHGMAAVDLAIAGEAPATDQAAARSQAAIARDTANRAYAGRAQGLLAAVTRRLGTVWKSATTALPF